MYGSNPYCERCGDSGMVSMERIESQPEALRCSCYLSNPVIKARHKKFDEAQARIRIRKTRGGRHGSFL